MAAWHPGPTFEPPDSGFTERARSAVRNGALYGPPSYRRDREQLARDSTQAEGGGNRGEELGRAFARVDVEPVGLLDPQQHPDLVQREHGQVDAGDEHRRGEDAVLAGEARDELLADRAA